MSHLKRAPSRARRHAISRHPLARCEKGATIVEFALIAPVFLLMLLGTMEVCRLMYVTQAANEVAYSAARCLAVDSNCSSSQAVASFAQTRAAGYSLGMDTSSITSASGTACGNYTNAAKVQFTVNFASPLSGIIPIFPNTLSVTGCFSGL